jgi:hypothetical protein
MSLAFQSGGLGSFSGFLVDNEARRQVFLRLIQFLGAFAKLRKATISPCVYMELGSHWMYFHEL